MRYVYPGNVRELQNIIERAVVMARGDVVTKNDLSLEGQEMQSAAESLPSGTTLSEQVEDLEKKAIAEALQQANGIQSRAADILGLTERNLRYKLKKYGLK
jgi:DNA-binding NtrC family response regulator